MENILDILNNLKAWHWLSLGIIFIVIDSIATGGFLLGAAVSALLMWLLKLTLPGLNWQMQLTLFAIFTLVFTTLYNRVFKRYNQESDVQNINNRAAQMIDREITLTHDVPQGQSKIQIGDTLWKVEADHALSAGSKIKIFGSSGMTLKIRAT